MSHHAENDSEFPEQAKRLLADAITKQAEALGLGATREFPRGKLHRTDEGGIRIAVTAEHNTVILAFGKPVAWIGFSRAEACELGDLLKKVATEL